MLLPQDILHKLELGGGMRFFRVSLAALAVLLFVAGYNWRGYKNMATQEAMDAAQLGRNIAQGKGFTTLFIRPFSMHLVKQHNLQTGKIPRVGEVADYTEIRGMHPDLANAPVYPVVLAALMKVLPFNYTAPTAKRSQPDFLIALFNQLLFLGVIAGVFLLARHLFDRGVAWLSAGLLLGTELFWRFSVSGLSTMLLMLIFLGLAGCLVLLERELREPRWGAYGLLVLTAVAGAIVALGGLTRYSFGWLILPVLAFVMVFGGQRRLLLAAIALIAFAGVMAPWIARNYSVSGHPFGTATYAVVEGTMLFPDNRLQRSLEPSLGHLYPMAFWLKLNINLRQIITTELPKLGGSWVTAFFLAGLMVGFRSPAISRLRYFLLGCLPVLSLAQALGRTHLSDEVPEINSENLLVLVAPLVTAYGVGLFFILLDQIQLPLLQLRYAIIGVFSLLACLPMLFVYLPPQASAVAYPPYFPPAIRTVASWLREDELAMSDIPWAVAWYRQRQCVWLTLKCMPESKDQPTQENFMAINDYQKPVKILFLTPQTIDFKFLSQWARTKDQNWGWLILNCVLNKRVPEEFPLRASPDKWLPEQLVLADWQRWHKTP